MSYTGTTPKFESVEGDNIKVDGNTISSTNTDGDINLVPDGAGKVTVPTQSPLDSSSAAASTEYVDEAIAAIPPVDLSAYATTEYVDTNFALLSDLSNYATLSEVSDFDAAVLAEAKDYTDLQIAAIPPVDLSAYETIVNVDSKDAATLASANLYTDNAIAAIPAGEVATAANVGTGSGVYKEKVGSEFKFKTLKAGSNVTITPGTDEVTIAASSGGGGLSVDTYSILDGQTDALLQTLTDRTKSYDLTYSVNRSVLDTVSSVFNKEIESESRFVEDIYAVAVQPDGKILVGGMFTSFLAQLGKNYLIRLNADGTEDTAFSANAVVSGTTAKFNNTVRAIAVQPDGKILVGGEFTNYATQTGKNYVIRLNSDGTEDTDFSEAAVASGTTAKFSSTVFAITVQLDGKILLGGAFLNYATQTGKSRLIRLNSDGTEDFDFSANAVVNVATSTAKFSSNINHLAIQSDGKILVGGAFTNYKAQTGKSRLIRLNSDGTEDLDFSEIAIVDTDTSTAKFSNNVFAIAVQSDGKILVGGSFTNYATQTGKSRLIRLNSDGTEDFDFSANAVVNVATSTAKFSVTTGNAVSTIIVQSDGKILVGGAHINYAGQTGKSRLIRLNSDGTEDFDFSTNAVVSGTTEKFNFAVFSVAVQSDGKILIAGAFATYSGSSGQNKLIRLNSDGTSDSTWFKISFSSRITAIAVQPDGKILVGGNFRSYKSQLGKNYLIRLNSDYTEDTAFTANAVVSGTTPKFNNGVAAIAIQSDGKILLGGTFTSYAGQAGKNFLVRLNSDGTEDFDFSANAVVDVATSIAKFSSGINHLAIQSDGRILVAGSYTNYAGQTGKSRLIRLDESGFEDEPFSEIAIVDTDTSTAKFNSGVSQVAVQSDGKILVVGFFTNYATQTGKSYVIRLNSDGSEDTSFSTNAVVSAGTSKFNAFVSEVTIQANGKILFGGSFTNYATQTGKSRLIRLNSDGTEDFDFSANAVVNVATSTAKINATINAIIVQIDGKILIGGGFTDYAGQTGKSRLIRLNADGTEDTVFSETVVVSGTASLINNTVFSLSASRSNEVLIGGDFTNLIKDEYTSSYLTLFAEDIFRAQIGKVSAIASNSNQFIFSTPTTFGPEAGFDTGVTLSFGTDGSIKYSSTTLNNPDSAIDEIKIEKKDF
jgi:uncharacterized delta-60 repeat protein